jgi:hypothetical protein
MAGAAISALIATKPRIDFFIGIPLLGFPPASEKKGPGGCRGH